MQLYHGLYRVSSLSHRGFGEAGFSVFVRKTIVFLAVVLHPLLPSWRSIFVLSLFSISFHSILSAKVDLISTPNERKKYFLCLFARLKIETLLVDVPIFFRVFFLLLFLRSWNRFVCISFRNGLKLVGGVACEFHFKLFCCLFFFISFVELTKWMTYSLSVYQNKKGKRGEKK